nr:cell division protein ZapA [uncultured Oribacterium sp.]
MADKKTIQVIIDGKIYVLSGENSESYLHDVADYLNHKIESIRKEMWNYNKLEESVRSLLLQINICDELFQERKKVEEMQELLDQEKSESYSYKHDLVKTKLKLDGVLQELESTQKKLLALEKKEAKGKV